MRTVMLVLAATIGDNDKIPVGLDLDTINDWLTVQYGATVVAVLDRDKPENNVEPQIFAAYEPTVTEAGCKW